MLKKIFQKEIFYGWYIVVASFIIMATGWGIAYNVSSIFIEPVSTALGLSRKAMNFTFTLRAICQLIISLSSVVIYRKFKMLNLMKVSGILLGLSFFSLGFINSKFSLYFLTIIYSSTVMLISVLPLSAILNNWFQTKRGLVVGISFMGSGVGGMVFNPIAGWIMVNHGWRMTYHIMGIIILLIIVPTIFFMLKIDPRDKGLKALKDPNETTENSFEDNNNKGIILSEAFKTVRFWAISLASVLLAICGLTLMTNIAPHLVNVGYSVTFAANVVALSMGSLAIGKLVLGHLFDRFSLRLTSTMAVLAITLGTLGMIYAHNFIALIVIIIGAGLGTAFFTIANPVITTKVFGNKDYSSIYGMLTAFISIGSIISPILVGYLFDITGDYFLAYKISLGISIVVLISYQFIFPKKKDLYE